VPSGLAYALSVAIGVAGGMWSVDRLWRRNPGATLRWSLGALARVLGSLAIFLVLAWLLGEWSYVYLAGGFAYWATLTVGQVLWPRFRAPR